MVELDFDKKAYHENRMRIAASSNLTDYFDKVALNQGGCDAFGWSLTKNFYAEIFICPDEEQCPGSCPKDKKCVECWALDTGRDSCAARGCGNTSFTFDEEDEEDRCIAPVRWTKVCRRGRMTIGCNSCYTLWYEDREGICQKCEASGGNAMMAAAIFLPFIAGGMYR